MATVTNPDFDAAALNSVEPDTATRHQLRLAHLSDLEVPREVVGDIFAKATESSLVLRLPGARQIPVGIGETVVRVGGTEPEAGQVGGTTLVSREGAVKPYTGVSWANKVFSPCKFAATITESSEFEEADPEGFAASIETKMVSAIYRAVDMAVLHGKDNITGAALNGIATNGYINATTNRVNLDGVANDAMYDTLLDGYAKVVDNDLDYDFTGWAADKRVRVPLLRAKDAEGRPAFQTSPDLRESFGSLMGLPVEFGKAVSGAIGANTDSGVRLFGGDFGQLAFGFANQIKLRRNDTGMAGDINLFETNQVAILIEVTFGWLVNDPEAFVAYTADGNPATS